MNRMLLIGLAAWVALASAASCASSDKPHSGVRIEHRMNASASASLAPPPPPSAFPAPPVASTAVEQSPSAQCILLRSERYEERTGIRLSPRETALMNDCPPRAWSENVPRRPCTRDDQCGDGFCDRGRCAEIWSCGSDYGRECTKGVDNCYLYPCIDGRCRSCTSNAECDWKRGLDPKESGIVCREAYLPGARECVARWIASGLGETGIYPTASASVAPPPLPTAVARLMPCRELPSESYEKRTGIKPSPREAAIMNDCPARTWSENVPKRGCTNDSQCGDGFCDRGSCAARWSCDDDYGRTCKQKSDCSSHPCIDGRCRSCASETECEWKRGDPGMFDVRCRNDVGHPGARECSGVVPSLVPYSGSSPAPSSPPP
jgi:hypothetical protein